MLRLSELLDRIRPAGSPGAASEGDERHRRGVLDEEIAAIARLLGEFEREADEIVAHAHREAQRLRDEAERTAHRILAGRADGVAVAESEAAREQEGQRVEERDAIARAAREHIATMEERASRALPDVVDAIVGTIWTVAP
jgi:vacuolar-type H+-ATPase subunit H